MDYIEEYDLEEKSSIWEFEYEEVSSGSISLFSNGFFRICIFNVMNDS